MAVYKPVAQPKPIEQEDFLGLNEAVGQTEIKPGEAVFMENFRITKNKKLQKRPGKKVYIKANTNIDGEWYGVLGGSKRLLFATNGNLYERFVDIATSEYTLDGLLVSAWDDSKAWNDADAWSESANAPVELVGSIGGASPTEFRWFQGRVIIKNTAGFYTYDGTTLAPATYTIPLTVIGLKPDGSGGTLFQELNLLTGARGVEFKGDGVATVYKLPSTNIDANPAATATVNGVPKTITVNTATGQVTFSSAPLLNDVVVVTYYKASEVTPSLILSHKYMTDYGVDNDTNLFLFGSATEKNVFRYSYIGDPFYYPANSFTRVDSDQFAITDLIAQYSTLIIYKERSAHITRPVANPNYSTNKGLNPYDYPYFDLNEAVGNSAPNMVQLIENNPITLYKSSMWLWSSATGIEDERNARIESDRVKLSFQQEDLSTACTYDYQDNKELFIGVGGSVYVRNYGNNTWYKYTGINAQSIFEVDGKIGIRYNQRIYLMDESYKADREDTTDIAIHAIMKSGFNDFGMPAHRKVIRDAWVPIAPDTRSSVTVTFATNKKLDGEYKDYIVASNLLDFDDVDFNGFSFVGNNNPQPGYIKPKITDFVYLQYIMENNEIDETLTVLGMNVGAQITGLSKR